MYRAKFRRLRIANTHIAPTVIKPPLVGQDTIGRDKVFGSRHPRSASELIHPFSLHAMVAAFDRGR